MYKIVDDVIHITRGDSAYIAINVTDIDGNPFYLDDSIEVRAQVRSVLNDDENKGLLFEGDVYVNEDGSATWHIKPADTMNAVMRVAYYYDIELKMGDDIFTIVSSDFIVYEEVTLPEGD